MTKYYRVRTQEQWDWLKNKLEIEDDLHVSDFPMTLLYGDVFCGIYKYHDDPEPLIEVSQMMEGEKMEDYVEIKGRDIFKIKDEENLEAFCYSSDTNESNNSFDLISYINELHIPKSLLYPKVPMTEAEKKEFDKLKDEMSLDRHDLDDLLTKIRASDYPHLYHRLYVADGDGVKSQLEFARAWADPSLIEVIPDKKWNVKLPFIDDEFYYKNDNGGLYHAPVAHNHENNQQFTAEEIKHYGLDNDLFEKVEVLE